MAAVSMPAISVIVKRVGGGSVFGRFTCRCQHARDSWPSGPLNADSGLQGRHQPHFQLGILTGRRRRAANVCAAAVSDPILLTVLNAVSLPWRGGSRLGKPENPSMSWQTRKV